MYWHPGRGARLATWSGVASTPGPGPRPWLAAGSQVVQQHALRDYAQAMAAFFDPHTPL